MRLGIGLNITRQNEVFRLSNLFAGASAMVWYDPSDLSTMFQDAAGTTPVTASGQPVGLIRDKSGFGFHASQSTAAARPTYTESGGKRYLVFDGIDDALTTGTITPAVSKAQAFVGMVKAGNPVSRGTVFNFPDNGFNSITLETPIAAGTDTRLFHIGASTLRAIQTPLALSTPVVYTALSDLAAPSLVLRTNGAQVGANTDATGGGNFRAGLLRIGDYVTPSGRFLNGRLYSFVLRFSSASLTADQIAQAEAWTNRKTGAY